MKTNKEKVFDFIVEYSKRFKTINDETPKLDTQFLSENWKCVGVIFQVY